MEVVGNNSTQSVLDETTLALNRLMMTPEEENPGLTPDTESTESLPPTPPGSPYPTPIQSALLRRRIDSLREVPQLINPPIRLPKSSTFVPEVSCMRVLLVDDNDVNLRILERLLKKNLSHIIHTVEVAHNADQALKLLNTINIDLVMMDIEMPGMSGVEATAHIRAGLAGERHQLIPIVAVTTKYSPYWRSLYLENGMVSLNFFFLWSGEISHMSSTRLTMLFVYL
jgi:CheY-like chemotaxis protein